LAGDITLRHRDELTQALFGCVAGAIGGATGAALSPLLLGAIDPNHDPLTTGQTAALGAFATLVGGLSAGLAGANAQAGALAGQNEALNNAGPHWGQPTSQAGTGLLAQRTNSSDGLTAGNPLTDPAAVACAGGTQTCGTQLFQTLSQARGANAGQAFGTMSSAAPYVGGALGVTLGGVLFGPEILAGCAANPILCVNQGAILTGEIYAGLNGMPVGTGASAPSGVSTTVDSAAAPTLFRGTTVGYAGSRGLQQIGITPTSTNPAIATAFATSSGTAFGNGVVQIALPADLTGIEVSSLGNASTPSLAQIENEFAVSVAPLQFANLASTTVTATQARSILSGMGISIPNTITLQGAQLTDYLSTLPTMSAAQIRTFLQKEAQMAKGH